jgi:hypothetical protein
MIPAGISGPKSILKGELQMRNVRACLGLLMCSCIAMLSNCSSGGSIAGDGDLVTVSGVVFDIDRYEPAEGVVVYLLDNRDKYASEPTGADGEYSIKVPAGSTFVLTTDDADDAGAGTDGMWYPLINMDNYSAGATIDEDTEAWPVHACPTIANKDDGSVFKYNNFIENATESAGFYGDATVEDNAGIIVWSINWLLVDEDDNVTWDTMTGNTVAFDSEKFPTGYVDIDAWGAGDANLLQEDGGTAMDEQGLAIAIGDPSFDGKTVEATFVTTDDQPANSPFEVIVRPNHMSYVQPNTINGEDANMQDFFRLFGLI